VIVWQSPSGHGEFRSAGSSSLKLRVLSAADEVTGGADLAVTRGQADLG